MCSYNTNVRERFICDCTTIERSSSFAVKVRSSSSRSHRTLRVSLWRLSTYQPFSILPALLGGLRFDAIHHVADVHAIGDGALVVVFGDEVLIEEADRLLAGRSSEPDEEGVEVFEDLPPEVVDGAVAFIGDDEIEGLERLIPPRG